MSKQNWWLDWQPADTSLDVFDSLTQPAGSQTVLSNQQLNLSGLEQASKPMALAAIGLQGFAGAMASKARSDNLFANVARTEANIDQMEIALRDALAIQVRKVSKRAGTQRAKIGASGVSVSGSPLMVMMESYGQGMKDYDAIHRKGMFAIDDAYASIYADLKQAKDIGTSMIVSGVSTAARGAFGAMTL